MLHPISTPSAFLFWTALPDADTDFTAEDPLALDYLAQQVGNWMFPGFTTRTSQAQYYLVVLYGLYLADAAVQHYGLRGDDDTRTELFERWERLWALATLEHRSGQIPRGDGDAMRGIRGAKRAWRPGKKPLPLHFSLISRQKELGGLGAYLSSLRHHRLVVDHTLRPSPIALDLLEDFWSEAGAHGRSDLYERYALSALEPKRDSIPRRSGAVTLALVGQKTRLSAIRARGRRRTRDQLWHILFESARDPTTLPLARQLQAAGEDVSHPSDLLAGMLDGAWGALGEQQRQSVELAQAFGDVAVGLLDHFDRVYESVHDAGAIADADACARTVFSRPQTHALRGHCARLLEHPLHDSFQKLAFHGRPFLKIAGQLVSTDPLECLDALLGYHREVQRTRRGGDLLVREGSKLTLPLSQYNGYRSEARFPSFKLWEIRNLLRDLGRLG